LLLLIFDVARCCVEHLFEVKCIDAICALVCVFAARSIVDFYLVRI
jgi:hypothetical protein